MSVLLDWFANSDDPTISHLCYVLNSTPQLHSMTNTHSLAIKVAAPYVYMYVCTDQLEIFSTVYECEGSCFNLKHYCITGICTRKSLTCTCIYLVVHKDDFGIQFSTSGQHFVHRKLILVKIWWYKQADPLPKIHFCISLNLPVKLSNIIDYPSFFLDKNIKFLNGWSSWEKMSSFTLSCRLLLIWNDLVSYSHVPGSTFTWL